MKTTRNILERLLRIMIVTAIITNAVFPSAIRAQDEEETSEATLPLKGRTISFLGDSISTYYGYSDVNPLTDEDVEHRYGEAYYGPEGTDCHNTDLSVEDTWWHQSLQQLGAELLISNATNSSAVFTASYPDDEDWDAYLKDMLAYKTRPYHLGTDDKDPDIIALYIGSGDAGWGNVDKYGDISTVRFDEIITPTRDGSYAYGEPQTVAEAYCIMLHKISVTYPQAEVYVFTVLPNSGGSAATVDTRLEKVIPFNEMVKGIAEYHHLTVVDLFDAFAVDPDGDGKITEEELTTFKSYFAEGPHPNAEGFDIITDAFNAAVLKNSRYVVTVESKAGVYENVETEVESQSSSGSTTITRSAEDYITDQEMTVDYESTDVIQDNGDRNFTDHYTSQNKVDTYEAEGGSDITVTHHAPAGVVDITIVMDELDEDEAIAVEEPVNPPVQKGLRGTVITGDPKESEDDGVYDYTITDDSQQGSISVVTKSISISKVTGDVQPDDMEYVVSQAVPTADNGLIYNSNIPELIIPDPADIIIPEGYSYLYVGHKNFSNYWAAYGYTAPDMEGFPDEEPIYTDENLSIYVWAAHSVFTGNRRLVVPKLYLSNKVVEGRYPARWDSIEQFAMVDKEGNEITAYCADKNTSAEQGYFYNISNLEDANYYTEEEAKMIRSIASHGYWGTQSGFGSLDSMKQKLLEDGGLSQDEVDAVTDGIAMTATQYAIWSFSNKMDKVIFYNAYYSNKLVGTYSPGVPADDEDVELLFKVYDYLVNLEPTAITEEDRNTSNTIINEKNFLKSVTLKVNDKPADKPENNDSSTTNDIYNVDLSFTLKVTPSTENGDSLVLIIFDDQGNQIAAGRVAGEVSEGETAVDADESGSYTMKGIELQEGVESLSFQLSGTQNLGNDVYMFESEVRIEDGEEISSQTLVGVAKGQRGVNIRMDITFELDVTDAVEKVEHYWRTEKEVPQLINIPVTKIWDDEDDKEGFRPEKITVHLMVGEKEIDSAELTAKNDWKHTFEKLEKYDEDLNEIKYEIIEDPVEGYETLIEGFTITNKHKTEQTEVEITKIWEDEDDNDGLRPEYITVHLLANGKELYVARLTAKNNWTVKFEKLDKYAGGNEIKYEVTEDPVEGYKTLIEGFTITNTHEPEKTEIEIIKIWKDKDDELKKRPESITVHLLANGTEVKTAQITAENGWTYKFEDLDKYADGKEISYEVTEDPVEGYTTVIDGFTIYNRLPVNTGDHSHLIWMFTMMLPLIAVLLIEIMKQKKNLLAMKSIIRNR